eukprot:TRINITY_DN2664_c0_g1_i4.p1 TRINITY_DN2664_c0_g1~~TRINITY_DN2664_c0_g1_i4.p1  ORF type:complete len:480 (+),score=91.17 TRINITY_DN2664_c0_g1_i4:185-1624(+)
MEEMVKKASRKGALSMSSEISRRSTNRAHKKKHHKRRRSHDVDDKKHAHIRTHHHVRDHGKAYAQSSDFIRRSKSSVASHSSHSSHSKDKPLPYNPDDEISDGVEYNIDPDTLLSEIPVCECPDDFEDPLMNVEFGSKKWEKEKKKIIKYLDMEAECIVWKCDFNKHQVKHVMYDIWEVALGNLEQATRRQFIRGCKKLHVRLPPCAFSLIFDLFDEDHTQTISRRNFVINLSKIMNDEEELLDHICEMVDFRKDKVIDKLEFSYAMSRLVTKSLILRLGNEHKIEVDPHTDLYHSLPNSGKISRKHTASKLVKHERRTNSSEDIESEVNDNIRRAQSSSIPSYNDLESSEDSKASRSRDDFGHKKRSHRHHKRRDDHLQPNRRRRYFHQSVDSSESEFSESHWVGHENDSHLYSAPDIDHQGIALRLEELFDLADKKKRGYLTFTQMKNILRAAEFVDEIHDVKKSISKFYNVKGSIE